MGDSCLNHHLEYALENGKRRAGADVSGICRADYAINERVVDLMIPFKSKWYDDPRCERREHQKVLPMVCPELSWAKTRHSRRQLGPTTWMEAVLVNAIGPEGLNIR